MTLKKTKRLDIRAAGPTGVGAEESEARYRTLFETLIEGFCTIEMIFGANGKPVDYRFLEINPAFEKQTGMYNAQGKLMRDLAPDHEAHWFEIYGKVALTGEPVHFENEAKALGRHYDVRAYRVGGPESRKVAILFNDIIERKNAERKLQARLEHLNLLQQITRAIGERQDLASIFQVVIRTLEDQLHIDFGCLCTYDSAADRLKVTRVGLRSEALATELALIEEAYIDIDESGLSGCMQGQLSYEPDLLEVRSPFPQRLARGGLRALVAAPLLVENKLFGVLIAARREAGSFSSDECEFLRQLSEHVALAAIVVANGGQEGIDFFRTAVNDKQTFDVIVTDLGMPYVDGRQVAGFAKAASPSTPVILLTGWGHRLMTEGDLPEHVDILLSKPPKLRELREALARCGEFTAKT
jgi:PAS domain S-box-containing protein